jgi:hypothetical protein
LVIRVFREIRGSLFLFLGLLSSTRTAVAMTRGLPGKVTKWSESGFGRAEKVCMAKCIRGEGAVGEVGGLGLAAQGVYFVGHEVATAVGGGGDFAIGIIDQEAGGAVRMGGAEVAALAVVIAGGDAAQVISVGEFVAIGIVG